MKPQFLLQANLAEQRISLSIIHSLEEAQIEIDLFSNHRSPASFIKLFQDIEPAIKEIKAFECYDTPGKQLSRLVAEQKTLCSTCGEELVLDDSSEDGWDRCRSCGSL